MAVFVCPNCSHTQDAPDEYVGRKAKCFKCETVGEITEDSRPSLPPPPPRPETASNAESEAQLDVSAAATAPKGYLAAIIVLLALLLFVQVFGQTSTKASVTQWEYKIASPSDLSFDLEMRRLGEDGWELVSARRATSEYSSVSYEMIFKRPKR